MNTSPIVSVVIPTYNRESMLPGAIDSVLAQTYKNVEIVVVDDGSTDGTQQLLKGYGDRIRVLRTDNAGPSHARNVGMRASRGKYIAFLDSDDSYYPYKLSLQVEWMERHPEVGLVSTEVSGVFIDGTMEVRHLRRYHTIYEERGWEPVDVYPDREDVFLEGLGRTASCYSGDIFGFCLAGTLVMTNTLLFRREALDVAGYQNEAYRFAEDYDFVLRMCKHFRAGFIDVPTYMLRYHEGQISRFATKKTMEKHDRLQLESSNVMLAAVVESAYDDPPCYLRHKKTVDARMAELNAEIGELWQRCGDPGKGREHLRKSYEIRGRSLPMLRSWISPMVPEMWKRRLRRVRAVALLSGPIILLSIFLILWVACGGGGGGTVSGTGGTGVETGGGGGGTGGTGGSGGGDGGTGGETPSRTVAWDPPSLFSDGSELVSSRDLSHYEIHIHETNVFLESDAPAAAVPAVDGSGNPVTSFDLSTLSPQPESGKTYHISVRAVETNGGRSAFILPPLQIVY